MSGPTQGALRAFLASTAGASWSRLPFFAQGVAERVAWRVDERAATGARVLPPPGDIFNALALTPFDTVRVAILGQDPYPTPGDANGLAFSYVGHGRLPASLKTILAELCEDCAIAKPACGDLSAWAREGVLLLNTALTVEAGKSGAHMKYGWAQLTDDVVNALSARATPCVFMLWGGPARQRASLIDQSRHLVLQAGHPSPLNRLRDFRGAAPFSQANAWLKEHGLKEIDWALDC